MEAAVKKPGFTGAKSYKGKRKFRPKEKLVIKKNSTVKDDCDLKNQPFKKGEELSKDVTGAQGKQAGEPYYDEVAQENRVPIRDEETDMILSVPESRLENVHGRGRKSYGSSPAYRRGYDRIFGNRRRK
jgi:hypothetical protein